MKLETHSLLPWTVDESKDGDSIFIYSKLTAKTSEEMMNEGSNIVVECEPTIIRRANFEFIALAVNSYQEMLQALKDVLEAHEQEIKYGGQVYTDDDSIRKAIAKAEGK